MKKQLSLLVLNDAKTKLLIEIISSVFVFLYSYTALSKLFELKTFKSVLSRSPLIGHNSAWISWLLPCIELFICMLLFFPATRRLGLYISAALMSLFTIYVLYMVVFSIHLPCACGGVISNMSWNQHLVFNMVFTGVAFYATGLERKLNLRTKLVTHNLILT